MRDPDDIQAYKAKQQCLVEEIVASLREATQDHKDYRAVFGKLALSILNSPLLGSHAAARKDRFVQKLKSDIWDKIQAFIESEHDWHKEHLLCLAERNYLHLKVFEKVMASVSSGVVDAYQAEEMKQNYSPAK